MFRTRVFTAAIGLAAAAALCATLGCASSPTSASQTVTEPPFTGTLGVLQAQSVAFTISKQGSVTITITQFTPQSNIALGVGLGQPTTQGCQILNQQTVTVNEPVTFSGITAGSYCAAILDIGYVTQDNTFTMTITHS